MRFHFALFCFFVSSLLPVQVSATTPLNHKVKLFAHRGGKLEQDENTIAAFKQSYDKGLRGFEIDIRFTKDQQLILLHDDKLDRTTHGKGFVEEHTLEQLQNIQTKQGNPIPTLAQFLEFAAERPGLYVEFEMKTSSNRYPEAVLKAYCEQLYAQVTSKQPEGSDYVFTSFDPRPLQYLKQKDPNVDILYIFGEPLSQNVIDKALAIGAKRIGCRIDGTSRNAVQMAKKAGLSVSLWPGLSIDDFLLGVALGSDYLCSDVPIAVREFVNTKMPWLQVE